MMVKRDFLIRVGDHLGNKNNQNRKSVLHFQISNRLSDKRVNEPVMVLVST